MPGHCSVCRHTQRTAIEQAHVEGLSLRAIAKLYPYTTPWSLARHFKHIPSLIAKATARELQKNVATAKLPSRVEELIAEAEAITKSARRKNDIPAALSAIRTRLTCLEMLGKISGELRPGGAGELVRANVQINVGESSTKKMTHEQLVEHIRSLYNLPPRKPPTDKVM
jgi:hypothetical protein